MQIDVKIDFSALESAVARLAAAPATEVLEAEGEAYLAQMRERFLVMSRGGWTPLAEETNREREWLGFTRVVPILIRDTYLFHGLYRGWPGNRFELTGESVRVGYGGDAVHPGYPPKKPNNSKITIAGIAAVHQYGLGRCPVREILVPPTAQTMNVIQTEATNAWGRIVNNVIRAAA